MRALIATLSLALSTTLTAAAEPILKIINFTADWCRNCRILDPRIDEALLGFEDGAIEVVRLDMTNAGRGASPEQKLATQADAIRLADANGAGYLWDWYGGATGIAVAIAADNGEPITCFQRTLTAKQIEERLNLAKILAERAPPGRRKPNGPDCIPPIKRGG